MLSQFSAVKIFRIFIYVNNIPNLVGGSVIYVAALTSCLFVSDDIEIYFNVPRPGIYFFNISYQSDYPIAHTLNINFNNCLSQIR